MLRLLSAAWRARRVLLIGGSNDAAEPLEAWLTLLGARCACLPPDADAQTLYRALTDGRVFAVIVCGAPASDVLLEEVRETGVPLTILCRGDDAQEAALSALHVGARFLSEGLPCGVYDANEFFPQKL